MKSLYLKKCQTLRRKKKEKITIFGWINKIRNLGSIIFIDIRNTEGITQVVFVKNKKKLFQKALLLRNEFCIKIKGIIKKKKKNKNTEKTKKSIEILAKKLIILNESIPLPIDFLKKNTEEIRLRYRYLDLRNRKNFNIFKIRSKVTFLIRKFMEKLKFLEIETPFLSNSTPEGAREYIIPSRIHKKRFYSLPQSPQIFKQILMIAGFQKYYQIVKCFRDEDLRSSRQPEFTQIDIEASFMSKKNLFSLVENMIKKIWLKIKNIKINNFLRLKFKDCIKKYGTDKPDLRNPLKFVDIHKIFNKSEYKKIFKIKEIKKNRIIALLIPNGSNIDKKNISSYIKLIKKYDINFLFYIKIKNIKKNKKKVFYSKPNVFKWQLIKKIIIKTKAKSQDVIFFTGGKTKKINQAMHVLRIKIGNELNITKKKAYKFLWVTSFPMFKKNKKKNYVCVHHPFTAPKKSNLKKIKKGSEKLISSAYDLVLNGYEIGGGSIRINNSKIQKKIFNILNVPKSIQEEKFKFFTEALKYGAPPHLGIALGLDRLMMLLINTKDIKDVIAFPKTTSGSCLLTGAPSKK